MYKIKELKDKMDSIYIVEFSEDGKYIGCGG